MNKVNIKFVAQEGAIIPEYKTSGAAGADVCAFLSEPVVIKSGEFAMIPTGLSFAIPEGYEIQVRPRSGLAAKNGVTVLNTPGTIDSDYRGEVKVALHNDSEDYQTIANGERIAQGILHSYLCMNFIEKDELPETNRGEGGFGSTGSK